MKQSIPIDEVHNLKTMPLCQKCLKRVATYICPKCGCPLCYLCKKVHPCLKKKIIN